MKKKIFFLFIFIIFTQIHTKAQVKEPTKWTISIAEKQVKIGDEVELIFTANIDQDWYIYTAVEKDDGPIPTKINLQKNATFQLIGNVILPTNAVEKYDDIFEMKLSTAKKQAIYKQRIKILAERPDIKANITFQTCSLTSGLCINGNKNLSIDIAVISSDKKKNDDKKDTLKEEKKTDDNSKDTIKEEVDTKDATKSTIKPTDNSSKKKEKKSEMTDWLSFIFTSFLGGFAAFLMPCIFPLLPSTVTYFVKLPRKKEKEDMSEDEKNALRRHYHREGIKKALFYGFSIVAIFTIVGTAVAAINGPAFANWLSTHWLPNVFFFLLFLVFGLSFLGLFELTLPNSWVMGADKQADKGGYYGIFFMAMTLVLVSFSCTGPIVGSLLIQAAGGQVLKPIVGMMSFSTALALPFVLFAIFPTWLSNMPKSGGWFGVLKVSLGFLELAIALKFLSTADQVYHWGILDREVFLAFWIVLFGVLGLYLLGKLHLKNEPNTEGIGVMRLVMGILTLSFTIYLVPGMFGAPLPPLAGILPPITTMEGEDLYVQNNFSSNDNQNTITNKKHSQYFKLPHQLDGFFDYKEGLEYAKKVNKPIFIDFTGHGCVNCREMEARIWSKPAVLKRLKNDFVLIALYVDDRHELPENEWYVSEYDKQTKKTIGEQNADFQIVKFNNNAQPYYCLLDHKGELLVEPQAYNNNVENFIDFLDKAKTNFYKK
ncbi:MAG: DUF255 domain-containing protein [Cytophagia bacterium]|nr:MAG: DUF255 domain-containing protein [Cytophagia bacterium]TAG46551.1 MAG: DUF255 domain-containing protein [Cytophagia bacterium]